MKFIRILGLLWILVPCVSFAAGGADFQNASNLLMAARRGDIQTVQVLINSGADVNFVDSTGLSLVCTAVMNNDTRAIQILQMYGADASNCDRQIKQYRQRTRVATSGEEYGFFSGLSSTHVVVLSAVGVAAVVGGVVLLSKVFDKDNKNKNQSSGSHSGGGGGGSGSSTSITKYFTIPYGPAYVNSTTGTVDTSFSIADNLKTWDLTNVTIPMSLRQSDFEYFRTDNGIGGGLLDNYLLVMGGYYALASGYMGQYIFRDDTSNAPILPVITGAQKRPVRVALITGNGINPVGSASVGNGITYAVTNSMDSATPHVDKYLNNTAIPVTDSTGTVVSYISSENSGFDLSNSGSAFNPFASINDSALAKIVAGWEGDRSASDGDLYGFVPNGQLAIYRTGNGNIWEDVTSGANVGNITNDVGTSGLSVGDTVVINSKTYVIADPDITNPTVTVNGTTFKIPSNMKVFIAECSADCTSDIAIYIGTDGYLYVNSSGENKVDAVYSVDSSGNISVQKTISTSSGLSYANFTAMTMAADKSYSVSGDPDTTSKVDVIANTNVIPASRTNAYGTVNTFKKAMVYGLNGVAASTNAVTFYSNLITSYYGSYGGAAQGGVASLLFSNYPSIDVQKSLGVKVPMLIMPAGDYVLNDSTGRYLNTLDATFENYAPMLYQSNLKHNFMTIVGVTHEQGTSAATTIEEYGNGTGSSYGKLQLSLWTDSASGTTYSSRMCGLTGVGDSANGVDPWCFAASGPTAEMATASAAGAVASVKAAFSYMSNDQVFTLLALTADGPYLRTDTNGAAFTVDSLVAYLDEMYQLPLEYDTSNMSSSEYLDLFRTVFGYGLINVRRAITPGFSVYYYDGTTNSIVSTSGSANQFWGNVATSSSRASSVLSLTNRSAINASFYDIVESVDGTISLPRVWNMSFAETDNSKHGLYMGDVLADFNIDSNNKHTNQIGNLRFDMAMSQRAYDDGLNGLDNLRVAFSDEKYDLDAGYQRFLTDGESRFSGRANGVLSLISNSVATGAKYKYGNFALGGRAFFGSVTDENLLENDPALTSQFEPAQLGLANGAALNAEYKTNSFVFDIAVGNVHENNTVLGMYSDGVLTMRGGDTRYIDVVTEYKPFENVKLSMRGTFASTHVDTVGGIISNISDIESNAFAFGADIGGFNLTAAMPLATVGGKMGYSYAEFDVVENDGRYDIAVNNPHTEYVDLSKQKRELRFSSSYKRAVGDWTDAGIGFIYRVNPNNTDMFGNESIFMFKMHHRLGI